MNGKKSNIYISRSCEIIEISFDVQFDKKFCSQYTKLHNSFLLKTYL